MRRPIYIVLSIAGVGCGSAVAPPAADPAAQGLPVTCDQAADAFLGSLRRDDPELGNADPDTAWFQSLTRLVGRRCELDHWSTAARACARMPCFATELLPWQQAGVGAVVGFALTPGFQREVATSPTSAATQDPREFPRSAAAIARLATCERPRCTLPDGACDAAVGRMVDDVLRPATPDDQAQMRRWPSFRTSLHLLLYDQCASGKALSGHDIGAWSAGARACFTAHGITRECTDQLTEPQRDSGEFLIAPWFDALRAAQ